MPTNVKISQLPTLVNADVVGGDLVPVVDVSVATTKKIMFSELDKRWAQSAGNTIRGKNTGGTGPTLDLTPAQATAMLSPFVGDTGSGGLQGLVPAPVTGDAVKFLSGDGTFRIPIVAANMTPNTIQNLALNFSLNVADLVTNLKDANGNPPSSLSPVSAVFRNTSLGVPQYVLRNATAPLFVTIPNGANLGLQVGSNAKLYWYLLDNAGTLEMAVSASWFDDNKLQNTTAMSGISNNGLTLYSTTARTGVAIRLIAISTFNSAPNGTWPASPDDVILTQIGTLPYERYYTQSNFHNGVTNGGFMQLTNGSIVLQPGTWRLRGNVWYNTIANADNYMSESSMYWALQNGSDTPSAPQFLGTGSTTIIEGRYFDYGAFNFRNFTSISNLYNFFILNSQDVYITISASTEIWLLPVIGSDNVTNSQAQTQWWAEKIMR